MNKLWSMKIPTRLKKLLLVALFASGITSNLAMASYVSDRSSGAFHALSDATLGPRDLVRIDQASSLNIDAGIRAIWRVHGMVSGSQFMGRNIDLSANKLNPQGRIRVDGGTSQITVRRALPALISDKSRPINWETFNLDGSGNIAISNRGDLSLSSPVPLPAASILFGSGLLGLLSFGAGRRRL